MQNRKGFTLIELLVVVLIIGILASVAIPQYFKVVEKGRASEAISILSSVCAAQERELLRNGSFATSTLNLDINVSYLNSSSTKCMLDLLDILEEAHCKGARISLVWRYDQENPRSLDLAQEFQEEVTLPFAIRSYQEEQS